MELRTKDFAEIFAAWHETMKKNREELVKLDQVAGDGDLGISMDEGFLAMKNYVEENKTIDDLGKLFYNAGKIMNDTASSSLGTLISAGFKEVGKGLKGKTFITGCELGAFLDSFQMGIIKLGGAKVGEKTFLDGFDPAVKIMLGNEKEEDTKLSLRKAALAAQEGSAKTVGMLACWGRAARRGEDSRQILDPGSVVASLIVTSLSDYINSQK